MKIYAINGSPRKEWNCSQLLEQFKKGFLSIEPDAEYNEVFLYDIDYKGCRSCFGCKLKTLVDTQCVISDDLHDILYNIRHSDGFVVASPIYFSNVSGEVKSFYERLMYPGPISNRIPVSLIYTMNANEEKLERAIKPSISVIEQALETNFKTSVSEIYAYNTLQRNHNELYKTSTHSKPEEKIKYHQEHWQQDLDKAYNEGVNLAKKARNV